MNKEVALAVFPGVLGKIGFVEYKRKSHNNVEGGEKHQNFCDNGDLTIAFPMWRLDPPWLTETSSPLGIERVIFNNPATIVFWDDGTKTVLKTSPNDDFDKEKAILWAYAIKNGGGSKTGIQKYIAGLAEEKGE